MAAELTFAFVTTVRPWAREWARHVADHGPGRVVDHVAERKCLWDEPYQLLVVDADSELVDRAVVEEAHRRGRSVVAVWDPADPRTKELAVDLGADVVVEADASPEEFLRQAAGAEEWEPLVSAVTAVRARPTAVPAQPAQAPVAGETAPLTGMGRRAITARTEERRTRPRLNLRCPVVVGAADALVAAMLGAVGWDRAFSHDASRTVGQFVTAPSLPAVFRQDRFNNHPLFSFLEYVFHQMTRSTDERTLRLVPIACGALAVGILAGAVARRFDPFSGHMAGIMLALNPLALRQFREVRGYALVTLAAVVGTWAFLKRFRDERARTTVVYILSTALAVGTHLFAIGLLAVHALVVLARRPRRLGRWLAPWGAVIAIGLIVQWPAIEDGLRTPPQYVFEPSFPARLATNLLGGVALPGVLVLAFFGWKSLWTRPWVGWVTVGTAGIVFLMWLAGPSWLDSRFFIWLAPATAAAAGIGASTHPRLPVVAIACAVVQFLAFIHQEPARSEVPNRIAAEFVRASEDAGKSVCALGRTRAGLLAYVDDVRALWDFTRFAECDVAVEAAGPKPQPLLDAACDHYSYVLVLPAKNPGAVFADEPIPLVTEYVAEAPEHAAGWEHTGTAGLCVDPPFPRAHPGRSPYSGRTN